MQAHVGPASPPVSQQVPPPSSARSLEPLITSSEPERVARRFSEDQTCGIASGVEVQALALRG